MTTVHRVVKPFGYAVFSLILAFVANSAQGGSLTAAEIAQIESDLGITLSAQDITDLGAIAKPGSSPSWRTAAEARIESYRKADLSVHVVDSVGTPVPGAQVAVKMNKNDFKFGGVVTVMDLTDASGNLSAEGSTTADWKRITTGLFNAVGLNNGFKPKLTGQHQYIPGFLTWAAGSNLDVRGHLLMWPGGTHLSTGSTSAYATHNVQGALDTYNASAKTQTDKDALKAEVDAEIREWVSQWDVYEWDVINETIGNHVLQDILGYDQMAEWFKIAETNKVSAGAGLYINEFKIISADHTDGGSQYAGRKSTYTSRINDVINSSGPITGVGFQSRFKYGHIDPSMVYNRLDEFATLYPNLTLAGTEFEVKDGQNVGGSPNVYTEYTRAQMTEEIMTTYFSHDQVIGLNAWDFMSATTDVSEEKTAALAWYDGTVKLNGLVWYYLHRIRYTTDESLASDVSGNAAVRAFKGDYDITVSYGGSDYPATLTLSSNQTAVVVLNDVTVDPGPVPTPIWVALEEWGYAGVADGSALNAGSGTGSSTTGSSWADKSPFGVVSNQMQRWAATGAANESGFNDIGNAPYAGTATGKYQISYDVVSADFSNTEAFGGKAQFGYGIRDATLTGGDRNGVVLVRYDDTAGQNKFRLSVSAGSAIQQDIASGSSISNLHIRAVYDLDSAGSAGSFIGYFSVGGGPETAVTNSLAAGFTLETVRMHVQALNGGNSWQPGDVVTIDNIVLSEQQLALTPESYYAYWLTGYPGIGATNLLDNADSDPYNNLWEYAFGGDPTDGLSVGNEPTATLMEGGGTNYIDYVYLRRADAAQRGLNYFIQLNTNLVTGVWTNDFSLYATNGVAVDADWYSVTNRIPVVEDAGFIRVNVEYIP